MTDSIWLVTGQRESENGHYGGVDLEYSLDPESDAWYFTKEDAESAATRFNRERFIHTYTYAMCHHGDLALKRAEEFAANKKNAELRDQQNAALASAGLPTLPVVRLKTSDIEEFPSFDDWYEKHIRKTNDKYVIVELHRGN